MPVGDVQPRRRPFTYSRSVGLPAEIDAFSSCKVQMLVGIGGRLRLRRNGRQHSIAASAAKFRSFMQEGFRSGDRVWYVRRQSGRVSSTLEMRPVTA